MEKNKALLVIDMQKGSFTPKTPRFDADNVVKRINSLANTFRSSQYPVIFIQHNGIAQNSYLPNTEEWELLSAMEVNTNDLFIEKYANDIFYRSKLQETLMNLKVEELFITGCATDFCVEATIQSAITKDYKVTVVKDAHTTGDRPHMKAEKIIEHYNWVWQNMIPTKNEIIVCRFKDIQLNLIT